MAKTIKKSLAESYADVLRANVPKGFTLTDLQPGDGPGVVLERDGYTYTVVVSPKVLSVHLNMSVYRDGGRSTDWAEVKNRDGFYRESPKRPDADIHKDLVAQLHAMLHPSKHHTKTVDEKVAAQKAVAERQANTKSRENTELDRLFDMLSPEAKEYMERGRTFQTDHPSAEMVFARSKGDRKDREDFTTEGVSIAPWDDVSGAYEWTIHFSGRPTTEKVAAILNALAALKVKES